MTLTIRPIDPITRRDFAGEVSGIDLREPMTPEQVAAVVAGMDKFAVLVFRDQQVDDAQQLAFSRNFGPLEEANADIRRPEDRQLASEIADISNLGRNNEILARDDRRRLFSLGNIAVALRQLVQTDAGQVFAAACARAARERRQHRICRHARRL